MKEGLTHPQGNLMQVALVADAVGTQDLGDFYPKSATTAMFLQPAAKAICTDLIPAH